MEDGNNTYLINAFKVVRKFIVEDQFGVGCTDPLFIEFDPLATKPNDDMCMTEIILGCTDSTAINYAGIDVVENDIHPFANNYDNKYVENYKIISPVRLTHLSLNF